MAEDALPSAEVHGDIRDMPSARTSLVKGKLKRFVPTAITELGATVWQWTQLQPNVRVALASALVLAVLALPAYRGLVLVPALRTENARLASQTDAAQRRAELSEASGAQAQREAASRETALRRDAVVPSASIKVGIPVWTDGLVRSTDEKVPSVRILPGQIFQEFGIQSPHNIDREAIYYVEILNDTRRTLYSVSLKGSGFPDDEDPMGVAVASFPVSDLASGLYSLAVLKGQARQPLGTLRFRVVRSE
jgi:hypothetical protein